jgi:diaminopimelate epimerase
MRFTKLQGSGNDFVLVEADEAQRDWSQLALAMCDRHFGIGADGLLLVLPSAVADFKMRVFDPDGSEARACGNGLICLVEYALKKGLVKAATPQILVETISGTRKVELQGTGTKTANIKVDMGEPKFKASDIPVVIESGRGLVDIKSMLGYAVTVEGTELLLNLVSMGNPHAVYFWQRPVSDFPLSQLGPKVEHLPIFPDRVNFEVARVVNQKQIEARVWERGVGETLACGSGACAITVAAQLYGYIGKKVDIKLPGGTLVVEWDGTGEVFLCGPAEISFNGEWPDETVKTN